METLFQDSEVFVRERPTKATAKQSIKFYTEKAQEILDNDWSSSDIEDIITDLENLYPFYDNGYELAKELEGFNSNGSYDIDPQFVDWLDSLSSDFSDLIRNNVKEWVKATQPFPALKIGDKIKLTLPLSRTPDYAQTKEFFITGIHSDEAKYVIHKESDYKGGTIFNFEDVERCSVLL